MMIKLKNEKIILSVLVVVTAILVGYNIFSVEAQKIETQKQLEENARMEREMLENIKLEEAKEIAEYYQKYRLIKAKFLLKKQTNCPKRWKIKL